MGKRIYGELRSPKDVTLINRKIRADIRKAKSRARLIELLRRSQYLITLTYSPTVKKALRGKVLATRKRARKEYEKTRKIVEKKLKRVRR